MGAEFSLAFEDNPVPLLFKWSDVASANRRGPYISKADADSIAEQNGVRLNISSSGVSRTALDIMIGDELDRQRKQSIIDRAPSTAGSWAVGKGAGFAAGFADPISLAANFIPVVGQGTRIAQMANASRLATRVVGRTAVGAVEGAVGAAMFEPLMVAAKHGTGREHTAADVAADIAGGAAMAGVLHPFVGGVADSYRALTGKAQPWALPGTSPVAPEVQAALDAGRPTEPLAASGTVYGRQTRVKVGSDYVPARWAVVDADEVAPAMDKGEGQYRDRTRAASDAQIQGIARNIDFDELHWSSGLDKGAPTLTRDGTIVGGNGRMAAIRQAYDLPSGQAYSIPLRERLQGEFGINPDAVRGMKKPALVRVFEKDVDTRAAAVASNEGGTLRMSALEQAKVDGERLGRVDLASADDGRLDVPENRGAIRRWVEQFPDAERAALLDAHGSLSPEGVMRLRNAALHNAFGDSPTLARLVDSTDSGLGRVSSALIKVAGKIADVRAAVGRGELHDIDIATDVLQAVERLANLRENGMPVDVYLRQEDLLGSGLTPEATKILAFLGENLDSSRRMAEGILGFYRGVERAGDPSQGDIFGGGGAPDRGALLESSLQAVRDDRSTAEAKLEAVSPQTREAAVSVAASQVMSGKDVDVQPIVDADPAIGTATSEDILSMFSGQDRPEAHRTVDMDASREVAANVARAPKAWDASHAKLEADAAVLELERLAKNQDEAWKYSRESRAGRSDAQSLPDRIDIDGVSRPTKNSAGRPLAQDEEGIRNFWKWFGDSKVVDEAGNPLIVYHGGKSEIDDFSRGPYRGILGAGYFSDSPRTAMQYAISGGSPQRGESLSDLLRSMKKQLPNRTPTVTKAHLSIKNPIDITSNNAYSEIFDTFTPQEIDEITKNLWIGDELDRLYQEGDINEWRPFLESIKDNPEMFRGPTGLNDDLAVGNSPAFNFLATTGQLDEFMKRRGYDGFIFPDQETGANTYVPLSPTQIKSATGNRGTFDPSNQDIRFSRQLDGIGTDPVEMVATIERMARDAFGDASAGLMEAGRVSVVAHQSDLPGGPHPGKVRAMTAPDGRVYMVAENMGSKDVRGLLLHEVGVHVGLPQMLGPEGIDSVLRDVDALLASGDAIALAARKAVPCRIRVDDVDTPAHLVREETLAYLVQNHPKIDVVRRLLAAVRAWLYEKFPALRDSMRLRPADLVSLATAAIRRTGGDVEAGGVRYSRSGATIDPKSELQPYEDAVEKAGKYAAAVRAAAQRWGDDVAMRAAVEQASGGVLVGREIEDLISTLKARHGEIVRGLRKVSAVAGAEDRATSMQDAAMAAAELIAENEERAALVEKRNAALALQAKTRGISYVLSQFPGREAEGMKALIAGSQLLRAGARTSVALESQQFHGKWLGGLEGDLRKAGLWQFFVEDAYQDDVARALWQHSLEEPDMAGIHPDAVRIADIVNRYQQDAKLTQNRYGAWIGNLRGWMYRQAHDMDKLRSAGIAKWSDFVDARLDWDRITEQLGVEDPAKFDRAEFLRAAFHDLSNGDHFKPASLFEIRPSVGPGNMAKKVSQSRTLHWKDANSATAYLREFGPANGSLAETVLNDFRGSARAAGLMKVLGPNYEGNLQAILDHVGETLKGTPAGDKWSSQASEVMDLLHHVDGSLSIPHNWLGAKIGAGMRNWQSMAKLGAAVVSQVSDIPVYAAAISHRFDVSIFDGLRDAVSGMLQGRPDDERREILSDCGHFFESVISQSAARFDPADVPGKMAKHMERFFKWGGITWWAETLRSSAVLTMARRLGDYHGRSFGALPAATRDMLSLYRIDEARWGLLRMAATREVDGKVYLTPEGLRAIPEAALADHLQAIGREASPAAVSNLRADLTDAYRSLLLDQSQYAALEPDARTRAFLLRGSRPGTVGGEILLAFAQFKSFPVVYAQRVLGREVYGRGYDSVGAWVKSKDTKAYMAMFNLIWTMTAAGYVSSSVKDLLKIRTPRPLDDPRTWMAAFMQGGALGIYGDYLFGSSNRLGGGIIGSIAGPVPGSIAQGYELYQKARDFSIEAAMGEDPQPADVAASALNLTLQNTPYLNLHLLRPALNAALIWSLQERLNPGYLQRSKRNLKRNQGSSYLIDPQAVAW